MVTVLSLPAGTKSRLGCLLPVLITPGPGEPVDLDSFLVPLMAELSSLAVIGGGSGRPSTGCFDLERGRGASVRPGTRVLL